MPKVVVGAAKNIIVRTRRIRRRWAILLSLVVIVGAGLLFVRTVLAVHDTGAFELDGNATDQVVLAGDDWENIFNNTSTTSTASTFVNDGSLNATISRAVDRRTRRTSASGPGRTDPAGCPTRTTSWTASQPATRWLRARVVRAEPQPLARCSTSDPIVTTTAATRSRAFGSSRAR